MWLKKIPIKVLYSLSYDFNYCVFVLQCFKRGFGEFHIFGASVYFSGNEIFANSLKSMLNVTKW